MSEDVVEVLVSPATVVEVTEPATPIVVEIVQAGPAGPPGADGPAGEQGPQGIQGPIGPEGPADTFRYVHPQLAAAATWTITHNLGGYPNVIVVDSAGSKVEGDITYLSANELTVAFAAPFAGSAYLS